MSQRLRRLSNWRPLAAMETTTVQQIAPDERLGRPRHLLWIWFSMNVMPLTLVTGVVGPTVFHLSLVWSCIAIVVGNLIGGLFMALHAAQGPQLAIPQMVQTRSQFGSYGALLVVALVVVEGVGFAASIFVVGGQTLHALAPKVSVDVGVVILAVLATTLLLFGYELFHRFNRAIVALMMLGVVLGYVWIFAVKGLPTSHVAGLGFTGAGFLGMLSVSAVWQIAYAPYVSDYSRYMSPDHKASTSFWTTYGGSVTGSVVTMILGSVAGWASADPNSVGVIENLSGAVGPFLLVVLFIGAIDSAMVNCYTPMLSSVTIGQTLRHRWLPKAGSRAIICLTIVVVSSLLAILGQTGFLTNYTNFLNILLYALAPWTAINLVDFYLLRGGKYDIASILRGDGGVYGRVAWTGVTCYVIGFLIQIPFMNIYPIYGWSGYVSPVASALGGADISWLVGIGLTAPLYLFVERQRFTRPQHSSASVAPLQPVSWPAEVAPEDLFPSR